MAHSPRTSIETSSRAGRNISKQLILLVLIGILAINVEGPRTPVIGPRVVGFMRTVENVFVCYPANEFERNSLGKDSSGRLDVEEIYKRLRRNVFGFSGPHGNERDEFVARFGDTFNWKMQSQFNFLSPSTTKVLELQNYSEIFSIQKFSSGTARIEENIRSFGEFESGFRYFRTLLGCARQNFGSSGLFFQVAQSPQGNPPRDNADENQSPVRPERVGPDRQWAFVRLLLGLILLGYGGWRRIYRTRSWAWLSFVTFLLGGCLLFGPRLP